MRNISLKPKAQAPDTDAAVKAGFPVTKLPARAAYQLGESTPGWRRTVERRRLQFKGAWIRQQRDLQKRLLP